MDNTLSIRISGDLAKWLDETARKTRVPKGKIVRQQLEIARAREERQKPFMSLAGVVDGPRDLSLRKGYSKVPSL